MTKAILACGVIAGPLYLMVGLIEILSGPVSTSPATSSV